MPGGDRTGPLDAGPGTGRGMGYCGGFDRPVLPIRLPDSTADSGFGGHGWRHRFYATGVPGWVTPTPEQETVDLEARLIG